jgi:hypothetical protein
MLDAVHWWAAPAELPSPAMSCPGAQWDYVIASAFHGGLASDLLRETGCTNCHSVFQMVTHKQALEVQLMHACNSMAGCSE